VYCSVGALAYFVVIASPLSVKTLVAEVVVAAKCDCDTIVVAADSECEVMTLLPPQYFQP
jgi:hypothetical protein